MRTYIIVPSSALNLVDFSKVLETSRDTLRYSNDKKFFTLKYTGDQPDFVFEITNDAIGLTEYSHDEILEILEGDNWKIQD